MKQFLEKCWNQPYLLLVLTTFFWGGNAVVGRFLADSLPPITISAIRISISVLIFIPLVYKIMKKEWPQAKKHFGTLLVLACTGVIGYNLLIYWALNYTTAINATLINSTSPLFIGVLSYLFLKEKLTVRHFLSMIVSMVGIMWVTSQGSLARLWGLEFNRGDLIMFAAVLSWAIYSVIIPKISNRFSPFSLFGYSLAVAFLLSVPAAWVELQFRDIHSFGLSEVISLLFLGIFPSLCAFIFWNRSTLMVGPSKASVFINLTAVFASLLGFFILNERLSVAQLIGGFLVFLGVFISSYARQDHRVQSTREVFK
jgi:drug/metabolite transporter (DMT)-like permease